MEFHILASVDDAYNTSKSEGWAICVAYSADIEVHAIRDTARTFKPGQTLEMFVSIQLSLCSKPIGLMTCFCCMEFAVTKSDGSRINTPGEDLRIEIYERSLEGPTEYFTYFTEIDNTGIAHLAHGPQSTTKFVKAVVSIDESQPKDRLYSFLYIHFCLHFRQSTKIQGSAALMSLLGEPTLTMMCTLMSKCLKTMQWYF